jgi:hypothetical protein
MLNKNMEYAVPEPGKTLSSTDIYRIGEKTVFKKFAMLLSPFALASFGLLLTDSAAQAAQWTGWQNNCRFNTIAYTPWRALIDVRSSDSAARVIQVEYGNGNSERISTLKVQESRIINGETQWLTPSVTFSTNNQTAWRSPLISSLPWVSNAFRPRYANVTLTRAGGGVCTSKVAF